MKEIPSYFADEKELDFYNDDKEFMMHHKRTKRNMWAVLDRHMESTKMGIVSGMKEGHMVIITDVKLNRACSLLHVFWDMMTPNQGKLGLLGKLYYHYI